VVFRYQRSGRRDESTSGPEQRSNLTSRNIHSHGDKRSRRCDKPACYLKCDGPRGNLYGPSNKSERGGRRVLPNRLHQRSGTDKCVEDSSDRHFNQRTAVLSRLFCHRATIEAIPHFPAPLGFAGLVHAKSCKCGSLVFSHNDEPRLTSFTISAAWQVRDKA
jgi:hypothetical protein